MKIRQALDVISKISIDYYIDKPYIVGGLPRDIFLKKEIKTTDVDLTTNSSDILRLGLIAAESMHAAFNISDDGHITLFFENFDIDFSSNFISSSVEEFLSGKLQDLYEIYSRDFTINTLHMDINSLEISDPIGMAKDDLENKIIRTPMPPEITLGDDPKRVYRGIDFATRYGFSFADELTKYIKDNTDKFTQGQVKEAFITQRINKSIQNDPDRAISILMDTGLFYHIPLSSEFKTLLINRKLLSKYLEGNPS